MCLLLFLWCIISHTYYQICIIIIVIDSVSTFTKPYPNSNIMYYLVHIYKKSVQQLFFLCAYFIFRGPVEMHHQQQNYYLHSIYCCRCLSWEFLLCSVHFACPMYANTCSYERGTTTTTTKKNANDNNDERGAYSACCIFLLYIVTLLMWYGIYIYEYITLVVYIAFLLSAVCRFDMLFLYFLQYLSLFYFVS